MYGSWVLFVLILISSIPVILLYIWFRFTKYQFSIVWFLSALLTGAAAFFPALVLQELLTFPVFTHGRTALFYDIFVRIAFTEELSRLLLLFIFFWINNLVSKENLNPDTPDINENNIVIKGTAAGLIAGLGFSILETARFAASTLDINIVLLRIFTAALHAACGARVGAAAVMFRNSPVKALIGIFTAVAIHGVYNFMVIRPGFLSIAAYLIAVCALTTSILAIRRIDKNEDTP